jgi:predicted DNA-binding ribbon-helix-helix protein
MEDGDVSTLVSRNVTLFDRRTSMRLEPAMWDALEEISRREGRTIHDICSMVDLQRRESSLTAALRVFIVAYFRSAATDQGHANVGHGNAQDDPNRRLRYEPKSSAA